MANTDYISTKEAAEILGVSPNYVIELMKYSGVSWIRMGDYQDGPYLWLTSDVLVLAEKRKGKGEEK